MITDIDEFLRERYEQLGLEPPSPPVGGTRPRRQTTIFDDLRARSGLHPATEDLPSPDLLGPAFVAENIEEEIKVKGLLDLALAPLKFGLDVLSSGEYALANTFRSILKLSRGEESENPFLSFTRGLLSAFSGDEEAKTRFFDILTDLGWEPDTTAGHVGKFALGMGLGILLDPITYTGVGALAKSMKMPKTAVKEALKELGTDPAIANRFLRGQYGTKAFRELFGELKTKHLGKASEKSLGAVVQAESLAIKDALKAVLPGHLGARKALIGGKTEDLAELALKHLGSPGKGADWLYSEGWKRFFDPGGFKVGFPFTAREIHPFGQGFGIMGSRASSLHGLILGDLVQENLPLLPKIAKSLHFDKAWEHVIAPPLRKMGEMFSDRFVRNAGLSPSGVAAARSMAHAARNAKEMALQQVNSVLSVPTTEKLTRIGGEVSREVGDTGLRQLSKIERDFLGRAHFDWVSKFRGQSGDTFEGWLRKTLDNADDPLSKFLRKKGVHPTDGLIDDWVTAFGQSERFGQKLLAADKAMGLTYGELDGYFPYIYRDVAKRLGRTARGDTVLNRSHSEIRRTLGMRFHEIENLPLGFGPGQIAAKPTGDALEAWAMRASRSYMERNVRDIAEQLISVDARHAIHAGGEFSRLFDDSARQLILEGDISGYERLFLQLAHSAKGMRKGLPTKWSKALSTQIDKINRPEDVDMVLKWLNDTSPGVILAEKNIKDIQAAWASQIASLRGSKAMETTIAAMEAAAPDIHHIMQGRLFDTHMDALVKMAGEGSEAATKSLVHAEKILDKFKEFDMERHLPAVLKKFGITDDLASVTPRQLEKVADLFEKGAPNRRIQEFLKAGEDLVPASFLGDIKVKLPGVGVTKANKLAIDPKLFKQLSRYADPHAIASEQGAAFLKFVDHLTNPLKKWLTSTIIPGTSIPRPAFFTRNKIDLIFRRTAGLGAVAGVPNIGLSKTLAKYLADGTDGVLTLHGVKWKASEIIDLARKQGHWHHGLERIGIPDPKGVSELVDMATAGKYSNFRKWRADVAEKLGVGKFSPEKWGAFQENLAIVEAYASMIDRGLPVFEIADQVSKHIFDYSNMTTFEKVLSRFLLFYNYQRQSAEWLLDMLPRHPFILSTVPRMKDMAFDTKLEEALVPSWVRQFPFFMMQKDGETFRIASMRNMFTIDMVENMIPTSAKEFMGMINPILTMPIEYAMGRELYLDREILPRRGVSQTVAENLLFAPPLKQLLRPAWTDLPNGKKMLKVDGQKWHVLRRLWFSRFYRDMDTVAQTIEGKQGPIEALANLVFGVKIIEYDLDKQQAFLDMGANKAKSDYSAAMRSGDRTRAIEILERIGLPQ